MFFGVNFDKIQHLFLLQLSISLSPGDRQVRDKWRKLIRKSVRAGSLLRLIKEENIFTRPRWTCNISQINHWYSPLLMTKPTKPFFQFSPSLPSLIGQFCNSCSLQSFYNFLSSGQSLALPRGQNRLAVIVKRRTQEGAPYIGECNILLSEKCSSHLIRKTVKMSRNQTQGFKVEQTFLIFGQ